MRILKIADSFDTMTSYRPYRSTRTFAEAREEIIRGKGTDFDPQIVDVFLNAVDEDSLT
ncbi:MAG: HD-GYP domain-containing protein [Eubacteriales bacterium]